MSDVEAMHDSQPAPELPQSEIEPIPRPEHAPADPGDLDPIEVHGSLVLLRHKAANLVNEYAAHGCGSDDFADHVRALCAVAQDADELLYPAPPEEAPEGAEVLYARALRPNDRVYLEIKGGWCVVAEKKHHSETTVTLMVDGAHGLAVRQAVELARDCPVVAWRAAS